MKFLFGLIFLFSISSHAQEVIESTLSPELISPAEVTYHSGFVAEDIQLSFVASFIGSTHNMQKIYANVTTPFNRPQTFSFSIVGNILTSSILTDKETTYMKLRTDVGRYNSELGSFELGQTIYKLILRKASKGFSNKATLVKEYK